MTAYRIEFLPSAQHDLAVLPRDVQRRIVRLRVGDYRVIYQVNNRLFRGLVAKIGHRRQVYKRR